MDYISLFSRLIDLEKSFDAFIAALVIRFNALSRVSLSAPYSAQIIAHPFVRIFSSINVNVAFGMRGYVSKEN